VTSDPADWPPPRPPRSIRDRASPWTKPIGEVIYVHQLIDHELGVLIWLIKARQKVQRTGKWDTRRPDPPAITGGVRIRRFAELAMDCFVEARKTIEKIIMDLDDGNGFRNLLVHGRWASFDDQQLTLHTKRTGFVQVTPMAIDARGREAYDLWIRLRDFEVWVGAQNGEVTKLQVQRKAIVRLVRAKAGREGFRLLRGQRERARREIAH
jgi:hypothetical protein